MIRIKNPLFTRETYKYSMNGNIETHFWFTTMSASHVYIYKCLPKQRILGPYTRCNTNLDKLL